MDKDKFLRYAEIKNQIKVLEAEAGELGPILKAQITAGGADKVEIPETGLFTLKKVQVFKFTDAVKLKKDEVKKLEEEEKAFGVAKVEIREDLVFTAPKPEADNLD